MNIPKLREEARRKLFYARSGLRRRLENQTVPVESQDDRWIREIKERETREAVLRYREKSAQEDAIAEARRHEISVARSWGKAAAEATNSVVDVETLNAIGDTLSKILNRIERLEKKADAQQSGAATTEKRLDVLSAREKSFDERRSRQVATLERKLENQNNLIYELRTEVRLLKAQMNKPQPEQSIHVIHHE